MPDSRQNTFASLSIALAIIIAALIGSWTIIKVKSAGNTIMVTGSAKQAIVSDFVVWRGNVSFRADNQKNGFTELQKHIARVKTYFAEQGVPDSVITYGSVSSYAMPEYNERGRETGRILGYNFNQGFTIRSEMVAKVTELSQNINNLINEGVPVSSFQPEYLFTGLSDARIEMLAAATRDALKRAEQIAQGTGQKVGAVRSARMGVFQVTARNSTAVSDYGMYDTSTIDKDITAVVKVEFALH